MIIGLHSLIYADDADATRRFFRDVLGLRSVDVGGGWLVFALPPAELGIHPTEGDGEGGGPYAAGKHEFYLMCDDLPKTMIDLAAKGVTFAGPPSDHDWGTLVMLNIPGGGQLGLYQPKHPLAIKTGR
jgi:catechol 2,3-dioxygenase-like lactoylglutathione lyase family enzyme